LEKEKKGEDYVRSNSIVRLAGGWCWWKGRKIKFVELIFGSLVKE